MFNDKRLSAARSVIDLLNTHPSLRSQEDIENISRQMMHFKFFQDLAEKDENSKLHLECCKVLRGQFFLKDDFICKKGDPGNEFYLILKGAVVVLSGENDNCEEDKGKNFGNFEDNGRGFKDELGAERDANSTENKEVAVLYAGQSFGEMSLINDRPRYFSVKCLEATILAVLHKEDYQIIGKIQEKQINEKIEFIRGIRAFKNWTKIAVQKLSYFFKSQQYKKGNIIYKEGDLPTDVFLIKQGEFIFTQSYSFEAENKSQSESFGTLSRRKAEKQIKKKTLKLVVKQKGEFFGFTEIQENLPAREFTCTCQSKTGELLVISDKNFVKKINHPETLRIIEEGCSMFKQWLSPRIELLKEVEKIKDKLSFTPLSKIKVIKLESPDVKLPMLYSPAPMVNSKPTVLDKFLMQGRKSSLSRGRMTLDRSLIFPTEVSRERIVKRKTRVNFSVINQIRFGDSSVNLGLNS